MNTRDGSSSPRKAAAVGDADFSSAERGVGSNDTSLHRSRSSGSTNLCDSVAYADHGASAAAKKLETLSGKWLIRAIQGHTIPYIRR